MIKKRDDFEGYQLIPDYLYRRQVAGILDTTASPYLGINVLRLVLNEPSLPISYGIWNNGGSPVDQGYIVGGLFGYGNLWWSKEPGIGYRQYPDPYMVVVPMLANQVMPNPLSGVFVDYSNILLQPGTYYYELPDNNPGAYPVTAEAVVHLLQRVQ